MEEKEKTFIFNLLVDGKDDIQGHIAYALYKHDKIEWIKKKEEENGKCPTEEEKEEYRKICSYPGRLEAYKSRANDLLTIFSNNLLEEYSGVIEDKYIRSKDEKLKAMLDTIEEDHQKDRFERLKGVLKSVIKSGWRQFGIGFAASVTAAIFISLILTPLAYAYIETLKYNANDMIVKEIQQINNPQNNKVSEISVYYTDSIKPKQAE